MGTSSLLVVDVTSPHFSALICSFMQLLHYTIRSNRAVVNEELLPRNATSDATCSHATATPHDAPISQFHTHTHTPLVDLLSYAFEPS